MAAHRPHHTVTPRLSLPDRLTHPQESLLLRSRQGELRLNQRLERGRFWRRSCRQRDTGLAKPGISHSHLGMDRGRFSYLLDCFLDLQSA